MSKKILSLIIAACMIVSCTQTVSLVLAEETAPQQSVEDKRNDIKKKLDDIDKKLASFNAQSKETEEYIRVLDEKISYLNEQYRLAKEEVKKLEERVVNLEKKISVNEKEIETIKYDIEDLEGNMSVLNEEFSATYVSYCERIRAMYEGGTASSFITLILESNGIQNLLTRYQMISAVSKRDGELLESVKDQTEKIVKTKQELDTKRSNLSDTQIKLKTDEENLKVEKNSLLEKQEDMASQQAEIEKQQHDANTLLKSLNDKTKEYGEYRDITQAELDEIDAAIAEADEKYADPEPETTTAATTTEPESETSGKKKKKKKKTTTTTTTTTTQPSTSTTEAAEDYISLTYPCPKYTKITCAYGAYQGHSGCDFSTNGNENQRIVAADSGTVILVKLLEYSYGHYVVIRHDKKTKSGKTVYTLYAHNNDIIVEEGDYVGKGQKIANSGTTGNSTGPHCHFEVRVGGSSQSYAVDPELYLP